MGIVRTAATLLFIIALPIALATTNVRVVVNEPRLYEYATDQYDTTETTGIERAELLRASGKLRGYFNNDEDSIGIVRVERDGAPISLFSPRETAHLQDVKNLIQKTFLVQELSVLFVLTYVVAVFLWAREGALRTLATQLLLSGVLSLAIIGAVGALAVTGFEQSFEQFHIIAFDNDLWQLNPARDHLIQMFPQPFFEDVSLWIGIATMAEMAALALIALVYLGLTRRPPARRYALAEGAQA